MYNINDLYDSTIPGNKTSEERLFRQLSVIFRAVIGHKGKTTISAEDQEDIVQNAVIKVAKVYSRTTFRTSFAAWAHTILKNEFLNYCKRQSVRKKYMVRMTTDQSLSDSEPADQKLVARLVECLRQLHRTQPNHARIINLHHQGYTASEICERLGITANSLRVSLHRARKKLRACLEAKGIANE